MKIDKPRKKRQNVTVDEYLTFCQDDLSEEEYFSFEKQRVEKLFKIQSSDWIKIIKKQSIQAT